MVGAAVAQKDEGLQDPERQHLPLTQIKSLSVLLIILTLFVSMVNAAFLDPVTLHLFVLLQHLPQLQHLQQSVFVVLVVLEGIVLVIHAVRIFPVHLKSFVLKIRL